MGVIMVAFFLLAAIILVRLVFLTVIVGPENAEKAQDSRTIYVDVTAKRGTIYDRNGTVLACSVDAKTIYCNPYEVKDPAGTAVQLAAILGGDKSDYQDALSTPDTSFAYVYQKADLDVAERVEDLALPGIYLLDDSKRTYPCGQTGGQVIGVCDVDGNGLTGLELYYDDILRGEDGTMVQERGANGYPIAGGLLENEKAVDGQDIVISLDVEMQEYLENRLSSAVKEIQGKGGNAIVYDGETGEILAMATSPFLNPGDRKTYDEQAMNLTSITTAFEPGSIFKPITMTAAFEELDLTPDTVIFCPAALPADEYFVTDAHPRGDEKMSMRTILRDSSNVGMSLTAKQLGFGPLYDKLVEYNLTEATGVDYPGESAGYLSEPDTWSTIQCYNVSFGQGVMVTPLQVTRFYGALANDGVECTPHFLMAKPQTGEVEKYPTEKVIENTDAIEPVTSMMETVVESGTGTDAQIEGFEPAGKTGTAEFVGANGLYRTDAYNISFVGFLPHTNSKIVCFVGVTEVPGDRLTTPAFKDIMTFAINHYEITPE
ncbi:MAG: penicillin-binding protein 2 [Eggerthellaceae bacterium]|nr:penicillin-binding protein 2 [Eggerthellaceae bacterium]